MAIEINRVTNANVYLDGQSLLGRAEEIQLPVIKATMSEHKALGVVGKLEFFSGVEKLEGKIKWNSFYADVMKKVADPTKVYQLQCRSSLESYGATGRLGQVPVVAFLSATCKDFPLGNFKQHDNVELESNLSVYAVKLVIGGEVIVEFDATANIYKVNGVDIMAAYRANLGI